MVAGGGVMKNLRLLREEKGLSQQKLADLIGQGMLQSQIHNYEVGKYRPDIESLSKMADILNTTIDYLVGRTSYRPAFEGVAESGLTDNEQHLVSKYRRLKESRQRHILLLMDDLDETE